MADRTDNGSPPSPVRPVPLVCPTRKMCFRDAAEAEPYLEHLRRKDHPSRAARLTLYHCKRYCGYFHIGHNFLPVNQRTTRRGKHAPWKPNP